MTRAKGKTAHVIRLGTVAAALHWYLQGHEDAVSWTADVDKAIPFDCRDAAKRFAARRLGGAWHVAEVDCSHRGTAPADTDAEPPPERDAGVETILARPLPEAVLITREQGEAMAARRRARRGSASLLRAA